MGHHIAGRVIDDGREVLGYERDTDDSDNVCALLSHGNVSRAKLVAVLAPVLSPTKMSRMNKAALCTYAGEVFAKSYYELVDLLNAVCASRDRLSIAELEDLAETFSVDVRALYERSGITASRHRHMNDAYRAELCRETRMRIEAIAPWFKPSAKVAHWAAKGRKWLREVAAWRPSHLQAAGAAMAIGALAVPLPIVGPAIGLAAYGVGAAAHAVGLSRIRKVLF
jgi:hypothetical protein